ncbi:GNAT family N-acetyltransferase [Paenibacillus sp. 32352]|uniref:GNAT family N-acetyltransferase n=1 Tax=Paenibacillus sp. 32352 TaxID=1969111 RepID=UPI0015C47ACB|nr:GNAT family N-acetyltransferase [Paenibacillus sp. 32352]
MDHGNVQVVELSEDIIPEASRLIAQFKNLDVSNEQRLSECQETLLRLLRYPHAFCLLARIEDQYAGFLTYNWGLSTSRGLPILRIQDVYTAPPYRRKGAARQLLLHARTIAEKAGANRMQLETDLTNKAARPLYEELGFLWMEQKIVYMYPMNGWRRPDEA